MSATSVPVHGCSPYHGGSRFFFRGKEIPSATLAESVNCRSHFREEIAFETLQGWSDRHNRAVRTARATLTRSPNK